LNRINALILLNIYSKYHYNHYYYQFAFLPIFI
jgi:hypothetical protein